MKNITTTLTVIFLSLLANVANAGTQVTRTKSVATISNATLSSSILNELTNKVVDIKTKNAKYINNDATVLEFSTNTASNVVKYIIEKSTDGLNYKNVIEINAIAIDETVSYTVNDYETAENVKYRITAEMNDGKLENSSEITIEKNNSANSVAISKKIENSIIINSTVENASNFEVKVIDAKGKIVKAANGFVKNGNSQIELPEISELPAGNYFVSYLDTTNGISKIEKVIKL